MFKKHISHVVLCCITSVLPLQALTLCFSACQKIKKDMQTSLCTIWHCSVPAGSEIAGPSCVGHFGTLQPVLRAESEPRTAVTSLWRRPCALHQSGTPGQTWWSSGSPWPRWTLPPLLQLSRSLGLVWSERDKLIFTITGMLFSF